MRSQLIHSTEIGKRSAMILPDNLHHLMVTQHRLGRGVNISHSLLLPDLLRAIHTVCPILMLKVDIRPFYCCFCGMTLLHYIPAFTHSS